MPPTPYKYTGKYVFFAFFGFFGLRRPFLFFYGIPEAREVSRNLPGARGFAVLEYEPVATHHDPIHPQNYQNLRH